MNDTVNLSLPSKPEYVSVARLTASFVANKMGFDIEAIEDIKLAVGEACNNAVLHSGSKDTYNLEFRQSEETLFVEIKDFGNGFNFSDYHEPSLEDPQESGLGLFIIKSLMDEVVVETEKGSGTKIIMSKIVE
ncbi:MAG: RsbW [uncultured bacterium (gcode 4)]|uniref:RsbW n=1 Tax=uncultured bacterium (gcode 4) TaxID=1234023 RepID=K2FYQ9_9BACT|nr:MAG: RsbW [uncultured bacterium (gcode 4)]